MLTLAALLIAASTASGGQSACDLLTGAEIAAVQGAEPSQKKPSARADEQLVSQQCFFQLPQAAQSVVLEVRRATPASGEALRARWRKMTEPPESAEREREERERRRDGKLAERHSPRKVRGIGKDALWLGEARAGALYVLARGAILRISVGGAASEEAKLAACKTLARLALARLSNPTLSAR